MTPGQFISSLGNWSRGRGALHQRLAIAIVQGIKSNLFSIGSRLPSERALANALSVSRTTTLNAYEALRAEGWIESKSGSGTWVSGRKAGARNRRKSETLLESGTLASLIQIDDEDSIDLAFAITDPLYALVSDPNLLAEELKIALEPPRTQPVLGLLRLRDSVASMYRERGVPTASDQLLITSGAQQSISLLVSLYVQRGDVVLVEEPTYFGALDALRLAGARMVPLAMSSKHIDPTMLKNRILATGARLVYLTPSNHNPTGVTMPEAIRRQVAKIVDDLGTVLLEDETLADLTISGTQPRPIAHYSLGASVFTIGSMSKLYWTGLRVGWIRGSRGVLQELARLKTSFDLASSVPSQAMSIGLLNRLPEAKAMRKAQLKARRDLLVTLLEKQLPKWQFAIPNGGLCLWVKLPQTDARRFASVCLRHGVAVAPGQVFSVSDAWNEYLRVPFLLTETELTPAVERLANAWEALKENPVSRVESIGQLI